MSYFKIYFLTLLTGLCMSDSKVNLALNAKAVQSFWVDPLGDAKNAVDGNTDSDFFKKSCTITAANFNPWWRVDLGNIYRVYSVSITNRGDCCIERLRGAQIRVGNSLDNNGNDNELAATILTAFSGIQTFTFSAVNGRYVNIFLPGNEKILSLCEVQVFGDVDVSPHPCFPKNRALGAKAVQSTTYELSDALKAIDGNRNPVFKFGSCSHTNGDKDPWWRVDLLDVFEITKIGITNRGDCCEGRINGVQIRIGNSLENNGNNNTLAATVDTIPAGATKAFEFNPVEGRYVNLYIPGRSEFLTLCEVEVFGVNPPPYPCAPRNLALGAKAVQSSTYESSDAQKAVDGNRNPVFSRGSCSATNGEKDSWWRVDLLDVFNVTRVSITNRGDCCAERINGVQIRIGNSLENNGNNNALAATVDNIPAGAMKTFVFNPVKGRYVNLYKPGRIESLTLCEVEVFAGVSGTR